MHKQQVCVAEIRRAECFKKRCPLESVASLAIDAVVEQEGCDIHLTEPSSMMKRDEIVWCMIRTAVALVGVQQ